MTLVYSGVCSHGPGITGRADLADPALRDPFYAAFHAMRDEIAATKPDALIVLAAEHFANFFMDKMPSFAIGMGESYTGPIEDPDWLKIPHRAVKGDPDLSRRIIAEMMQTVDLTYCEEWRFDHGIMVPLHFLDPANELTVIPANINCQGPPLAPLHRAWAFGEALRRAADAVPERIALVATGGISHWPATPDSGKINEEWDREFMRRWVACDKDAMLSYTDEETYRDGGQGGFEIRAFIAAAAAAQGQGTLHFYTPIPIFAVGCTIASMEIA
ncbi:extradiol ring-cleavage dioxygenase [Novosphingobium mangrovi (ex Huang et al. 2023)]|uniref:Extradiol ring-cleavage dioxygenase n=1 Tax=Novosphingobium mangrovi (ex Huang et al. 2023) TaxID=2976432 RepID=A0ABT2I9E8_9SPHN|nr:extradiol ring-cleavage dioxygenase [Novosphingobium mangrovi (ex Huang et al. 2023)]MCT2401441.1 extradiol ring-cleavage dioxygenase [Novosphingobium mangrovi (ex Huang et al. 2023)]